MSAPYCHDIMVGGVVKVRYWLMLDDSARGYHEIAGRARDGDGWADIDVFQPDELHLLPAGAWCDHSAREGAMVCPVCNPDEG